MQQQTNSTPSIDLHSVSLNINLSKISPSDVLSSLGAWIFLFVLLTKRENGKRAGREITWKQESEYAKHSSALSEIKRKKVDIANIA